MKSGSDNYRSSAIQGVIARLVDNNIKVVIYEPSIAEDEFLGCIVETDIKKFKKLSDVIVTNRIEPEIEDVITKVYTRDIFRNN